MPAELVPEARRYLVGVSLLLCVVVLWTASNFITANLETGEGSWNKPFFITYLNTAMFTLYLIPYIWRRHHPSSSKITSPETYQPVSQNECLSLSPPASSRSRSSHPAQTPLTALEPLPPSSDPTGLPLPRLSVYETAQVAAWWSAVWFMANWTVNVSLSWTSVASMTILSSTSGMFTLALGRLCKVEELTRVKLFAVGASFLGVLLVTRSDSTIRTASPDQTPDLPTHPILGDATALLSASLYAVYVVLLKVRVGDEDRADMQLMLGFAGLFNTVLGLPVIPLIDWLDWEKFELPPTRQAVLICLFNMTINVASDYLYVLAMLKTTPMLVTIGLSLTIPLALVGSLFMPNADSMTIGSLLGGALVIMGFALLGWQGWGDSVQSGTARADETEAIDPIAQG